MSENRPKIGDTFESLTGAEVCAIEDRHGRDLSDLTGTRLTMSLLWALKRREGMAARDAWKHVEALTLKAMNDSFAPEPEDEQDDEPGDKPDGAEVAALADTGKGTSAKRGRQPSSGSPRGSRRKTSAA